MPLDPVVRADIDAYARSDLRSRQWHTDYFDFITDAALRSRLGEEFFTARYLYKIFEGLAAQGELQVAQVRLQVLQYASIYEAAIHHLLFETLCEQKLVQALQIATTLKQYSVPPEELDKLISLVHDGRDIVAAYFGPTRVSIAKIRFDDKARCANSLGLIDSQLCDDLIEIYEARNAIHLHAEIRKGVSWDLGLATKAYMRHQPFRQQIIAGLEALK